MEYNHKAIEQLKQDLLAQIDQRLREDFDRQNINYQMQVNHETITPDFNQNAESSYEIDQSFAEEINTAKVRSVMEQTKSNIKKDLGLR